MKTEKFVLSVNKYLGRGDKINYFGANQFADPDKIHFDSAISDLVCSPNYWRVKPSTTPPPSKLERFFRYTGLFPRYTTKMQVLRDADPAQCSARIVVRLGDVSAFASMFNGYDMTGLQAEAAQKIASRMRERLIAKVKSSDFDEVWSAESVSEITKTWEHCKFDVRIPEPILKRVKKTLQTIPAPPV